MYWSIGQTPTRLSGPSPTQKKIKQPSGLPIRLINLISNRNINLYLLSAYHYILSTCYQFSGYKGHPNQIPICFYPQHNHLLISEPNIISTRVSSRFPTLNLIITLHFKFESHNPICLDIILFNLSYHFTGFTLIQICFHKFLLNLFLIQTVFPWEFLNKLLFSKIKFSF